MTAGLSVAVIGGGRSCEHEVSLASARGLAAALTQVGHRVTHLTIGRDGAWHDAAGLSIDLADAVRLLTSVDVAVPALHGPHGEDGTLAALLDLVGVPYAGSPVRAGALGMDKWAAKLVAEAIGVATAPGRLVTAAAPGCPWSHPVVVKPVSAGSSHGVTLVRDAAALPAALAAALELDDRALVEDVVAGREVDLAVIGRPGGARWVSPALEIARDGVFDHAAKYGGSAPFVVPAPLEDVERKGLEDAAVAIYDAIGCAGVARVDFFLSDRGPVFNEINTMPGFTPDSQVPRMVAATGVTYPELVDLLVRDAYASR